MQLISLSRQPYQPCLLLKWPSVSILLDCALDLSSLASYLPETFKSARFSKLAHDHPLSSIKNLKRCGEHIFIDGPLEVHSMPLHCISMESVDAILISNWMSLIALPFFTENTGFHGTVYATDPTLYIGRLIMEELLEFFDRINREHKGNEWKEMDIFKTFPNLPSSDPREWRPFYSRADMENSLTRVQMTSFRESVNIHGVASAAAYSSGYSIGSCNWIIHTECEKVGYLSATSSRTSHTKAVHWDQLRGSDFLILTSICRFPEYNPEASVCNVFAVITETLKKHGSVLLPVCPTGVIYDLLEVISAQLDQHDISVDVPVYLISPVANNSLAYSNICAEWLSEKKQAMVYVPEEPFSHIQTTKNGRLHVYNSISGDFCRQMRTPCVLFTGHPSLRIGDAVHFLEMWGNDSRNAIIITDPDYPLNEVYGPFENLPIRAYFYPIETRLDYSQLNPSIIPDLAPKLLILAEEYSQNSHRSDFVIMHQPHSSFSYGRLLTISSSSNPKKVHLHPEMLRTIELHGFGQTNDFGISSVRGYLSVYDNLLKLFPESKFKESDKCNRMIRPHYIGKLDVESLSRFFSKKNIKYSVEMFSGKAFIKLNDLHAEIRIENNGERTKITCSSKEIRQSIADLISECLKKI